MKKKAIATMLVGSMLFMPLSVFADEEDNYLHTLRFDKIKTEMEARSPLISSMWEQVSDGADKIDDAISDLKTTIDFLENSNPIAPAGFANGMTAEQAFVLYPQSMAPFESGQHETNDQKIVDYINNKFNYLELVNYINQIDSLKKQLKGLEESDDDFWKSYIQVEQGKNQVISGAQQLFLTYFSVEQSRDQLKSSLDLQETQLKLAQLQESLGLTTSISTLESEAKIKELKLTLETLNKSLENMKSNVNIMLGQDYDTELTLVEPPEVTRSMIRDMDYDEDLEDALIQSYDVRLAEESDDIKQAKKEFTLAFKQVYQNVLDKQKALVLAEEKISLEQKKYDHNYLMFSLGLISKVNFDGLRLQYMTQADAVETAERNLLQAYTDYEWMKKGLTVSAGSGGASAPAASSGAGSMQSSGMGF